MILFLNLNCNNFETWGNFFNYYIFSQKEISGYKNNVLCRIIYIFSCVISGGILLLISYWRPDWALKWTHSAVSLESADTVLVKVLQNFLFNCFSFYSRLPGFVPIMLSANKQSAIMPSAHRTSAISLFRI